MFFFFQAEDGIRDYKVTGVQTCALPISALFGLNYISTVPPTTTLTANIYGRFSVGELSGWIFFAHQVGSALGAAGAGWIFEWTGSYSSALVSAAIMGFPAAGTALVIRWGPVRSRPLTPAPATT